MMKTFKPIIFILCSLILSACTKIIDIDLPTAEPRLVVEGNLDFNPSNTIDTVYVKLSLTTNYFNPDIPKVSNAVVWVEDFQNNRYPFQEFSDTGIYFSTEIQKPQEGDSFKLHIEYGNDIYEATETYINSPKIEEVVQTREKFFDESRYVLRVYYQDELQNKQKYNYYYLMFQKDSHSPQPRVVSNEFSAGNRMETLYIANENTQPGDLIHIQLGQISRNYYDFIYAFFDAINNGGGPFQTPAGQIVGNVKNMTSPEKEALGYFRILDLQTTQHVIYEQPNP